MTTPIPTVKIEGDENVKMEDASSPSAHSDQFMDDVDDDPELDIGNANQMLWISKLPTYLWEILATADDNDEIEIGTIRVEGSIEDPERVSLMLNQSPLYKSIEKEYVLKKQVGPKRRGKRPGQVMMFSEKDKPGYKRRPNVWDNIDEDGNPGQGRSQLYEAGLKDERKKANKGKFVPHQRRPIPKITALAGTVLQEFEAEPVDNEEHRKIDNDRTTSILKQKDRGTIEIKGDFDAKINFGSYVSPAERQSIMKAANARRTAAKENRAARKDKFVLRNEIFGLFREFKYWGLRDLRKRLDQPEQAVRECLEEIALMHRAGDFNGKWELKQNFQLEDEALLNAVGEAPNVGESDVDMKSEGDDDDEFEDVAA